MDELLQDLRFGLKGLYKHPGFAFAAILTLALGIGANTAVFTVVDAALLRPLPYREPERLVHLWELWPQKKFPRSEASYPDFLDWRDQGRSFEGMAGYNDGLSVTLTGLDRPEQLRGVRVTPGFFEVLGVEPLLGRAFLEDDGLPGAEPAVMLGHGLWKGRFGGDPAVVGRAVTLDGRSYTVVGVLPPGFHFAKAESTDLWVPMRPPPAVAERRGMHWVKVVGRLAPGVSLEQAAAEMATVVKRVAAAHPETHAGARAEVVPLGDEIVGPVRPVLLVLLGAVALVLLIACANVANLLIARSAARSREIAVRRALGASRWRVVRQLLAEGCLLALAGGALGLVWSQWCVALLVAAIPESIAVWMPYLGDLTVDASALAFTAAVSLATGALFSLAPALQATGADIQSSLKERTSGSTSPQRHRLRNALVVSEVAVSLVLLVGAGLLVRSLAELLATDPGFDAERLLTFEVSLPSSRYDAPERVEALHQGLLERLEALPGVRGAASTDLLPLGGGGNTGSFAVEGMPVPEGTQGYDANMRTVSSDYFAVMSIPVAAGRPFTDRDTRDAPMCAIVNETLASRVFPGGDAVGRRIVFSFDSERIPREIVGVVGDENVTGLDARVTPVVYTPYLQDLPTSWATVVRTSSDPASLAGAVRGELLALDPDLPAYAVAPMERLIAEAPSTFLRRYPALLVGALAAVALALALVGIFGVISYSVSQRTQEIGIRMALGARPRDALAMVMRQGAALVGSGVAIGLVGALAASRLLSSLLFGVTPTDPATYLGVSLLLGSVALAACYLPARRATRVDPLVALREE